MKSIYVLIAVLIAAPGSAKDVGKADAAAAPTASTAAAISPEYDAAVRKLLKVSDALQTGKRASQTLMAQMTPLISQLCGGDQKKVDAVMADMMVEFNKRFTDEAITSITVKSYADHVSLEDVKILTEFYSTEAGARLVKQLPLVMKENMEKSGAMTRKALPEIMRAVAAKHPEAKPLVHEEPTAAPEKKP